MTTTAPHAQPATDAPVNPAGLPTAYEHGNRLTAEGTSVDPILVEIVQGTLASVEMEVETAIARTSRSPMIRDAHDFRAGIHDRQLRKLTGRSYSALVHLIARDFPLEEMAEGDVFFHNDVYESEGGIGHLPDLCVTVPVFHGRSSPSSRPSATTTTSAARAGIDAQRATSVFEEGLSVPPIKAVGQGSSQQGGAADHDPQLAHARQPRRRPRRRVLGLPHGRPTALRVFARYGRDTVEAAFDHPRPDDGDLPPRDPLQDPGRHLRLGGLRRARRRRRPRRTPSGSP